MGRRTKQSSSSSFWYSSRSRSSSAPATPRPEPATVAAGEPPVGCMSMVHYLIFAPGAGCVGRPPTSSSNAIVTPHNCHGLGSGDSSHSRGDSSSKSGVEAPRNSLDLDADNPNDIQIGVQIEPVFDALASRTTSMRRSTKPTAPSSEAETPRTPSLVARLMGIDGLPDQQPSPSPAPAQHKKTGRRSATSTAGAGKENSNSNCCSPPASEGEKKKRVIPESMNRREPLRSLSCNVGVAEARSLPDTPRASTSARASWEGPRLSLQALKENVLDRAAQYMSMPSSPTSLSSSGKKKKKDAACSRRRRDEKAAKEHAREILRQAKETVASRKSGKNGTSASPAAEKRQSWFNNKENVMMSNPAAPAPAPAPAMEVQKLSVVFQQTSKPTTVAPKPRAEHHSPRVALAPRRQQRQPSSPPPPHRAKPSRPPPPPPPLDPPPTRARKPDGCERFATRIKKPAACPASAPTTSSSSLPTDCCSALARVSSSPPLEEDPEYSYLRTVLERGGFMPSSPPPRRPGRGHSVASPVDPIVFHLLELELPADEARLGALRHRWNRKLLFHLAQELLADLLLGLDASSTGLPLLGKRLVRGHSASSLRQWISTETAGGAGCGCGAGAGAGAARGAQTDCSRSGKIVLQDADGCTGVRYATRYRSGWADVRYSWRMSRPSATRLRGAGPRGLVLHSSCGVRREWVGGVKKRKKI